MSDKTSIEWTEATWNPVRGCSRITPGCGGPNHEGGCYAEKIAARFSGPGQPFEGFAERTKFGGRWTGKVALIEDMLALPLRWRKPRRIFVNSMSDLFHENLPDEAIDKVFAVMALCPQHTFQVLTKRADRMREWSLRNSTGGHILHVASTIGRPQSGVWPLPNVWLGVSVEDQARAEERIPVLLDTPAAVRWISAEPLLGPLNLAATDMLDGADNLNVLTGLRDNAHGKRFTGTKLDWVVAGGESGPGARPAELGWFRSLRDQCAAAGVPFFFKQWGAFAPVEITHAEFASPAAKHLGERWIGEDDNHVTVMRRLGKKAAGALLDGREHREFPR